MTDFIDKLKENVKDILFPVRCPYCEIVIHKTEYACESCKKQFPSPAIIKHAVGGYKCTSPFPYDGIFKKAVKNFKFGVNFSISFSQLKTTDVGHTTRFGCFVSFSFALCKSASV